MHSLSILILSSIIFQIIQNSNLVVVPKSLNLKWTAIHPELLKCPATKIHFYPLAEYSYNITITRPTFDEQQRAEGILCHKFELTTTCYVGWLGSQVVTKSITASKIKISECQEAYRKYAEGDYESGEHPAADCSYFSTTPVTKIHIKVTPHPVHVDPYSDMLIDPIFPSGRIGFNQHTTIHDSAIWFMTSDINRDICKSLDPIEGILYFPSELAEPRHLHDGAIIWSDEFPEKTFKDACRIKFCNHVGIRFNDGEWLMLNFTDAVDQSKNIWWSNLPACRPDVVLRTASVISDIRHRFDSALELLLNLQCINTIQKLRQRQPITVSELAYLIPLNPGPGNVYQLTPQGLLVGQGLYVGSRRPLVDYIKLTQNYSKWHAVEDVLIGPNGLTKSRNGTVRLPEVLTLRTEVHADLSVPVHFHSYNHNPSIENTSFVNESINYLFHNPSLKFNTSFISTEFGELWHSLSNPFKTIYSKVLYGIVISVLLIIVFKSRKEIWNLLFNRTNRKNHSAPVNEMPLAVLPSRADPWND
ncbi:glycoprotein [Wuhan House Fly Virus 1]|uniref:Glycoprotein n=1 Tax=Wuhan House Fly Virus 1 TaxID=1608104 RepID=A0A0B5KTK4_9RHAB|nr:glycoprotein [Wuhan House Fly Virus 1]AJG39167.1 glycoprotein [Wuhan House Fly Virus 1]